MPCHSALSALYRPIQPRHKDGGEDIFYREIGPHPMLTDIVCYYWELKTTRALEHPFEYSVIADGCIDFFFDMNAPGNAYAAGFASSFTSFSLDTSFHYVGIRFFPGALPCLWNISAKELRNESYPITEVLGCREMTSFSNDEPISSSDIFLRFNQVLINRSIKSGRPADWRVSEALHETFMNTGESTISTSRHLRRLFDFYIGASPKEFSRVVRFQRYLRTPGPRQSAFYDFGYFDQSHFIRDFKTFYGQTPAKAGV